MPGLVPGIHVLATCPGQDVDGRDKPGHDGAGMNPVSSDGKVCIAKFGAAHGVRGEIRLWPFTEDPRSVASYGPLETQDGKRQFEVISTRAAKDHLVARIKGIDTRDAAEKLNGLELYVAREKLPATDDDEFYHADLIGLAAVTHDGTSLGRIIAVHNFGAGDIIEIAPANGGETKLLPFTNAVVPTVDLAAGRATIVLPEEIAGDDPDSAD
jgi:16S rRNA processing protein RimM